MKKPHRRGYDQDTALIYDSDEGFEISVPADPARTPAFEDVSNADNESYIRPW